MMQKNTSCEHFIDSKKNAEGLLLVGEMTLRENSLGFEHDYCTRRDDVISGWGWRWVPLGT